MTFVEALFNIVKYSVSWVTDKAYLKYYAILAVIYFFINLFDPSAFAKLFDFQATGIMLALFVVLLILLAYLALVYFSFKLLFKVMSAKYNGLREFNFSTFIGWIAVSILTALAALFSVFELKWLLLLLVAIIFGVGALLSISNIPVAVVLGAVAAIAGLLYLIIVIRNSMRLFPAFGFYLQGNGIRDSLSQSWVATAGKALLMLVIWIIEAAIVGLITVLEFLPQVFAGVADTVGSLLGVPIRPFSAVVAAIFSPASLIIQTFFMVGIYSWIKGSLPGAAKPAATKPAAGKPLATAKRQVKKKRS